MTAPVKSCATCRFGPYADTMRCRLCRIDHWVFSTDPKPEHVNWKPIVEDKHDRGPRESVVGP